MGSQKAGSQEEGIWRSEVPRAHQDSEDDQEGDSAPEVQGMQQGGHERRNQVKKGGDSYMRREREPIPKTKSEFFLVKCPDCDEERILFSNSAKDVGCRGCGRKIVESKGGKSVVQATLVKRLG
jgi:ribosomal protein S27E